MKLVEPKVLIPKIEINADTDNEYGVGKLIDAWGLTMPVISINNFVIPGGDLISFDINFGINKLPSFSFVINDSNYRIRTMLNDNTEDYCTIFIGTKSWYTKFQGVLLTITSTEGIAEILCNGTLYNPIAYNSNQQIFKGKSLQDILVDVCEKNKFGLFTNDNKTLSKIPEYLINPNINFYDFIKFVVTKYTDCVYSFDSFYYLHVANIETLRSNPVDKYTINRKGENIGETPYIFSFDPYLVYDEEKEEKRWKISNYTINTNYGLNQTSNSLTYDLKSVGVNGTEIIELSNPGNIGVGKKSNNIFSGFKNSVNPDYINRINNYIAGKVIKMTLYFPTFEILPFSVVDVQLYKKDINKHLSEVIFDEENSGKKIVINYGYSFNKADEENPNPIITQYLEVI